MRHHYLWPTESNRLLHQCDASSRLEACGHALDEVVRIKWKKFKEDLRQVVIRTSSDYLYSILVETPTQRMRNVSVSAVAPAVPASLSRLAIGIDRAVTYLNEMGVEVLFWRVGKGQAWDMGEADRLASQALEQRPYCPIRDVRLDVAPSSDSLDPLQLSRIAREQLESTGRVDLPHSQQSRTWMDTSRRARSTNQVEFSSPIRTRDRRESSILLRSVETWEREAARDQIDASTQLNTVNTRNGMPDPINPVNLSSPLPSKVRRESSSSPDIQELLELQKRARLVNGKDPKEDTPDPRARAGRTSSLNLLRDRDDLWRPKRFVNGREDTPHPMRSSSPEDSSSP